MRMIALSIFGRSLDSLSTMRKNSIESISCCALSTSSLHEGGLLNLSLAKDRLSNPPSCSDEVDRAQHEIDSMLFLRIVERESKLLPKIDKAIMRIKAGDYGFCLETGEPIGLERLISRPTAEYCAEVKTINEEKEKHFVD